MNLQSETCAATKAHTFPRVQRQEWADEHLAICDDLPTLKLDERGMILDCNMSLELLFGFEWRDLVWHHVTRLFPQLPVNDLVHAGQVDPLLECLILCNQPCQAQNRSGTTITSNLIFARLEDKGEHFIRVIVLPSAGAES